jgi:hypothetical protein
MNWHFSLPSPTTAHAFCNNNTSIFGLVQSLSWTFLKRYSGVKSTALTSGKELLFSSALNLFLDRHKLLTLDSMNWSVDQFKRPCISSTFRFPSCEISQERTVKLPCIQFRDIMGWL